MKKTLVALAVAAAAVAGSANAAVVYDQDGAKVELGGSFRAFLGKAGESRGDLKDDGSRITLKASQDLGNGLNAFAGYQLRFNGDNVDTKQSTADSSFNGISTRYLYAGLGHKDVGALSFGRQATNADDVWNDGAYYRSGEFGSDLTTRSDKSVKYRSAEWNGFSFGADYLFGHSVVGNDNSLQYKNGYGVAAFYNLDISEGQNLSLAASYTQDNYDNPYVSHGTSNAKQGWAVRAAYTYGPVYFNVAYGQTKSVYDYDALDTASYDYGDGDLKRRNVLAEVQYQVAEPTKVWFQWERTDKRYDNVDYTPRIINRYQVGADYKLHKNVITYAIYERAVERQQGDVSPVKKAKDNIYGVGLRVYF